MFEAFGFSEGKPLRCRKPTQLPSGGSLWRIRPLCLILHILVVILCEDEHHADNVHAGRVLNKSHHVKEPLTSILRLASVLPGRRSVWMQRTLFRGGLPRSRVGASAR